MNKFLVLLVTSTVLIWGVFLFKMSDKVNSGKSPDEVSLMGGLSGDGMQDIEKRLDFKSLLSRLKPQDLPDTSLRNPFALPEGYGAPAKARNASKPAKASQPSEAAVQNVPPIVLDAVLPGDKPVAILKFRGESAVVCVGQSIWDAVVVSIEPHRVVMRYGNRTFEVR